MTNQQTGRWMTFGRPRFLFRDRTRLGTQRHRSAKSALISQSRPHTTSHARSADIARQVASSGDSIPCPGQRSAPRSGSPGMCWLAGRTSLWLSGAEPPDQALPAARIFTRPGESWCRTGRAAGQRAGDRQAGAVSLWSRKRRPIARCRARSPARRFRRSRRPGAGPVAAARCAAGVPPGRLRLPAGR